MISKYLCLGFLFLLSCSNNKTCRNLPPIAPFNFALKDINGNDLLDSTKPYYVGDISIFLPCDKTTINTVKEHIIDSASRKNYYSCIMYGLNLSGPSYPPCLYAIIKYSNAPSDTISFNVSKQTDNGCNIYTLTNITFNKKYYSPYFGPDSNSMIFEFVKR